MRALILTLALVAASGIAWLTWAPAADGAPLKLCVTGMEVQVGQRDSAVRLAMKEPMNCGEDRARLISVSFGAEGVSGGVQMIATPI